MFYKVKKSSTSFYPSPQINCHVLAFVKEEDTVDESKAVYWIPFQHSLSECEGKTQEEINTEIKAQADVIFNSEESQAIFRSIEAGLMIQTPEII